MNLSDLFKIRSSLLENFESEFSKMSFVSDEEKWKYYHAYQDAMANFFVHTMIHIMDNSELPEDKAA